MDGEIGMYEEKDIDYDKMYRYWIESSDDDFRVMSNLYRSKSYNWALFAGHLSLEKLLKGLYVKNYRKIAPFTHNSSRLAELNNIDLTFEKLDWLDEITMFNLNGRYDDYKKKFHLMCTLDFTDKWIVRINELRTWIKSML
ncbi:MAG: HEPN domain-containing protein [Bacteroidia bacterium]|nr:HEPN domain-containing protein [Bacteroidia bacterium]